MEPPSTVEVRSAEDYGPVAERRLTAKRADYFAAGTLVVWDVDVLREKFVRVFRARDPERRPSIAVKMLKLNRRCRAGRWR